MKSSVNTSFLVVDQCPVQGIILLALSAVRKNNFTLIGISGH